MRLGSKLVEAGLSLIAILMCAAAVRAQGDTPVPPPVSSTGSGVGSIVGRVVLPSGHPVNGRVRITLSTIENPGMVGYTDNNGNFGFRNLREGNYTVEVTGDYKLYEPVSEQVRLMRGMQVNLTINLREKNAPSETTGRATVSAAEVDPAVPSAAQKEFDKAASLANAGNETDAIEHYKRALEIYPSYLKARNDLGVRYLKLNRLREAQEQFELAIDANPKAFNPRLNLGIVLVKQKQFSDAREHLRTADSIDSSSPAVHLYLGIVSVETDELIEAERELKKAISMGGQEYGITHYHLGVLYAKKGERETAIAELKTFLASPAGETETRRARQLLNELSKN